jgi:SAM-dependent methyltransferase
MIVCPTCRSGLSDEPDRLACRSCSYQADREDGLVLFNREILPDHEDYRSEGLDTLYAYERKHFWFKHRVKIILDAFRRFVDRSESIIEVGAGTGHTARSLLKDGYRHLSVGEIHRNGLLYAQRYGLHSLYQFDLRSPPFDNHFDTVALFDVLEHLREDDMVVGNIHQMLRKGGRIILTVPAHQWLWSRIDELSGHHRRYGRSGMMSLLERNGFEVLHCRYFFTALVPALFVRSLLARRSSWKSIETDSGLKVSKASNAMFMLAGGFGDVLLSPLRSLTGGSLLAVARKKG